MSTKKRPGGDTELEARANPGLQTLSHLPQTHADGRNNKWQMKVRQLKRKSSKFFGKVPTVHRCSPSVVVRLGGGRGAACGGMRRVQRSVWVYVCHRRLHVRSPELALASSSVLPPRLFRRHGRTCAYSTTQLYISEPLFSLTASVFSNIILKWMTK